MFNLERPTKRNIIWATPRKYWSFSVLEKIQRTSSLRSRMIPALRRASKASACPQLDQRKRMRLLIIAARIFDEWFFSKWKIFQKFFSAINFCTFLSRDQFLVRSIFAAFNFPRDEFSHDLSFPWHRIDELLFPFLGVH